MQDREPTSLINPALFHHEPAILEYMPTGTRNAQAKMSPFAKSPQPHEVNRAAPRERKATPLRTK
jgi:hypothetical protein